MQKTTIGVEQEHFVFRNGLPPQPADMEALFRMLTAKGFAVCDYRHDGTIGAVSQPTSSGPVIIKNDGCTHVLEVAFPPLFHPGHLRTLYEDVWGSLQASLDRLGMTIQYGGCLEQLPPGTVLYPPTEAAQRRQQKLLKRPLPDAPFAVSSLSPVMCATHIHIGLPDALRFRLLPTLYRYEYLVPLLYSTSPSFRNQSVHCARPLIYRDSFQSDYQACAFPADIPTNSSSYQQMLHRTTPFIRDYTFIAPREFGTLEFRTSCSQTHVQPILELIGFRLAAILLALQSPIGQTPKGMHYFFYEVCRSGPAAAADLLEGDLNRLGRIADKLPAAYVNAFDDFLRKGFRLLHRTATLSAA